ncbi:MAG: undecaprenyldiphospho-muramoylpentapeptide beta-N-acetylglucosaminyltransferase, partial [Pseudomonadota bacterium]
LNGHGDSPEHFRTMQVYGGKMNIVIAGGGTGGHLFPGIAIAQEFLRRDTKNNILFIGTEQGIEARMLPKLNFTLKTVPVKGFKGKSPAEKAGAMAAVPAAFFKAGRYVRAFQADIVVGLGGYISFPAVAAGRALHIPTVIHEQNSVPGLANRILGRMAHRVFVSYEESKKYFAAEKTMAAGMPVRRQFTGGTTMREETPFCLFVCGGSQGAHAINEAVIAALPHLEGVKEKIRFLHQTGQADRALVEESYKKYVFAARVLPFVDDMYVWYRQAHAVVSRAGASTLAELALCGKASVLIPYPFAAGNHQEMNARAFVDGGAGRMILQRDLTGEALAACISELEKNRPAVERMEQQAVHLAKPKAAETIVEECYRLAARTRKACA